MVNLLVNFNQVQKRPDLSDRILLTTFHSMGMVIIRRKIWRGGIKMTEFFSDAFFREAANVNFLKQCCVATRYCNQLINYN